MSKSIKIKYPMNKTGYYTRATQSILQYGVGAMVDFPDQTLMTAAPEFWANSVTRIHDSRLEKALHVKYFGMPGDNSENSRTKEGISYVRFPEWYFCPVCRRFKPLKEWIEEHQRFATEKARTDDEYMIRRPRCYKDKCDLVAAGLVTVCANGHINDFPWVEWAHIKSKPRKEICAHPHLTFRTGTSVSEGMQGLVVACEYCKARATLADAFSPTVFEELIEDGRTEFACQGKHPWKGTRFLCGKSPVTKQRGDTSVYFPCSVSSIVIPTSSDENTNRVKESTEFKNILVRLEDCDDDEERLGLIERRLDRWSETISNQLLLKSVTVKKILKKILLEDEDNAQDGPAVDSTEYKYEEYCALSGISDRIISGSEDFLREEMDISEYNIPGVKKIVLVKKLREVRALIGFSRLQPVGADDMDSSAFVSIKEDDTDWYPGYEVKGEGIFIQFDHELLNDWARKDFAIKRRELLEENFDASLMGKRMGEKPDAVLVFLHTMAHILLKQLSFECGYNIASLRERLYYMPQIDEETEMAGILLYTASGDSEGTLGGLVRQGRSDCFPRIFKEAIDKSKMCSNDPVCITSSGQGRDGLNLAACHACALIPETSCEKFNVMLDRALVVGTFEEPNAGFYSVWDSNRDLESMDETAEPVENNVQVLDDGQVQTGSYRDIWEYICEDTDDALEIQLFNELIELSTGVYEKPIYSGRVKVDEVIIDVDLIWPVSNVLFFLNENYPAYEVARNCGWKCFCIKEENIDAREFLNSIEVR